MNLKQGAVYGRLWMEKKEGGNVTKERETGREGGRKQGSKEKKQKTNTVDLGQAFPIFLFVCFPCLPIHSSLYKRRKG